MITPNAQCMIYLPYIHLPPKLPSFVSKQAKRPMDPHLGTKSFQLRIPGDFGSQRFWTPPETNSKFAPEKGPFWVFKRKGERLPTINFFQVLYVSFRECYQVRKGLVSFLSCVFFFMQKNAIGQSNVHPCSLLTVSIVANGSIARWLQGKARCGCVSVWLQKTLTR